MGMGTHSRGLNARVMMKFVPSVVVVTVAALALPSAGKLLALYERVLVLLLGSWKPHGFMTAGRGRGEGQEREQG